jgi:small conductance mechanosensitive channel
VNGVVWHIRNGTIKKAGNESQGWARAVVDFPVPYHHDIPLVRRTMMQAADAMWQEPVWHEIILEEPEVWGVQELSSDAVLMRVTARTVPLRQWEVQRELTERLKIALDAADAAATGVHAEIAGDAGAVVKAGARALADSRTPAPVKEALDDAPGSGAQ